MTTRVDSISTEESQQAQSPISKSTTLSSNSGPKVSMFGVKSGFVIPKNKLSGSLVPIIRSGGKVEPGDVGKDDSAKQVQRKTRWGADVTQDAAVRKGRSLAYQTRLEQITQQLKSGSLEPGEDQDSQLPAQPSNVDSVEQLTVAKLHRRELLELEKQELIGEILRLNPGYKAPPDYKPLLKEAKVPIPVHVTFSLDTSSGGICYPNGSNLLTLHYRLQFLNLYGSLDAKTYSISDILLAGDMALTNSYRLPFLCNLQVAFAFQAVLLKYHVEELKAHPGNNFIGLILGPASNTQKRLEEETGAKVRVYGIKPDTKEKCEITRSDATEAQAVYEETFVHIAADTYEKVDAAVALIELLVTPVTAVPAVASTISGSVAGDSVIDQSVKDSTSTHFATPVGVVNQGMVQPVPLPTHSAMPQFLAYAGPWHPHGLPNVATPQTAGFLRPPVSNNVQFTPPINHLSTPFSGGYPALGAVPRNLSAVVTRPEPPMQNLQRPLNHATAPPSHATAIQQPPSSYPAVAALSTPVLPAVPPSVPAGSMPTSRPAHVGPQPASNPGGFPYNRPLSTPSGSSSGFPAGPLPLRPNNMMHMVPPSSTPLQRPHLLIPQNSVALPPQPSMPATAVSGHPATNFTPRASFPLQPSNAAPNLPSAPHGGQIPAPAVGSSPLGSLPAPAAVPTFLPARVPVPSPRPLSGPVSAPSPTIMNASAQVSAQVPVPAHSTPLPSVHPLVTVPSRPSGQASIPASLPGPSHQPVPAVSGSAVGSAPNFPSKPSLAGPVSVPPITSPKPQQPSPGDFTFQPHRTQVSASATSPMPSPQPLPHTSSQVPLGAAQAPFNQNASQLPLAPPKAPSFRLAAQNPPIPAGMPGIPRPQSVGQMGPPPQGPLQRPSFTSGGPFPGNPTNILAPPRVPAFLSSNTPASAPVGLRNFAPAIPNVSSSIPSRPAPLVQAHNQPPPGHQPHGLVAPNQHIAGSLPGYMPARPASTPGGSQIYDPFSPSSVSAGLRQQEDDPVKARKPETDAEYEDLMASVGVR